MAGSLEILRSYLAQNDIIGIGGNLSYFTSGDWHLIGIKSAHFSTHDTLIEFKVSVPAAFLLYVHSTKGPIRADAGIGNDLSLITAAAAHLPDAPRATLLNTSSLHLTKRASVLAAGRLSFRPGLG